MRQIEDSWKINHLNPPNQTELLQKIHRETVLSADDKQEIQNYRRDNFREFIFKKCTSVCLHSKDLNFKNCFDNCEAKIQKADNVFDSSKKEYQNYKFTESFV